MDDSKIDDEEITVIEDTGESLEDYVFPEEGEEGGTHDIQPVGEGEEVSGEEAENLRREAENFKDHYMRTLAELENYKKRTQRDKEEHTRYAMASFFNEFLSIMDNFHRSVQAEGGEMDAFREGVILIMRQIDQILVKYGVKEVEVKPGDAFNPMIHEALSTEMSADVESQTVGEVLQKGYDLNGRLLRPALVKVLMPAPRVKQEEEKNEENHVEDSGD